MTEPWSRRGSLAVILASSLLLWAIIWLMVATALAGYTCSWVAGTYYCNDDNSTRTASCTYIAGRLYCN